MSPQKSQGTLLRSHPLQRAQASGPKALPQGSLCSLVRYGSPFAMIGTGRLTVGFRRVAERQRSNVGCNPPCRARHSFTKERILADGL